MFLLMDWLIYNCKMTLFIPIILFALKFAVYIANLGLLVAWMVKNLPAVQETWAWPQGREGPVVKGLATHSSVLAGRIPRTKEPGGLHSIVSQTWTRLGDKHTHTHAADLAFSSLQLLWYFFPLSFYF